ncbi:dihydrofolate reductase family protein [Isoptericola halotolerans]|uniref:dihydrofolate reductase family protein n=1 Tax=Isoptericola halotolerans TaxID=300560 RepID=UPI003890056F
MGTLRYSIISSLDGFAADTGGDIAWSAPSPEVLAWINEREHDVEVQVLGRRMYDTLKVWDDWPPGVAEEEDYAALWARTDKIVCSDTLTRVEAPRTTLEPRLTARRVREVVAATDGVVVVSGPTTAAVAWQAGLVDEVDLIILPQLVGGGLAALPPGGHGALRLEEERRFTDGTVVLRYAR